MKKFRLILLIVFTSLLFPISVTALQFGNELINVGDMKSKIYTSCGEPIIKEIIGYIDHIESEKRIRVMKIEEWLIEVPIYSEKYFYSLIFEGNRLKEITSLGKKK